MVIVAAHGDRAGRRIPLQHELHDGRGLLDISVAEVRRCENRRSSAGDIDVLTRIQRRRCSECIGRIGAFHVGAAHAILKLRIRDRVCQQLHSGRASGRLAEHTRELGAGGSTRGRRIVRGRPAADPGLGFQDRHGDRIGRRSTGVDEANGIRRLVDLGRLQGRIDQRHGGLGVAARHRRLRADQGQQLAFRRRALLVDGLRNAVHGVVGIVARIVLRQGGDHGAVRSGGGRSGRRLAEDAPEDRTVGMPQESQCAAHECARGRHHVAGQTELAVAGGREKVGLAALHSHQHFRAHEVGAAGQIEGDEGDAGGGRRHVALGGGQQGLHVGGQRVGIARLQQSSEPGGRHDHRRGAEQAGRDHVAAGHGPRMIVMQHRFAESVRPSGFL